MVFMARPREAPSAEGAWTATYTDRNTDLPGLAFGSFRNRHHVAQAVPCANTKMGNSVSP